MTEQPELKPTQAARNANEGHGHVFLRPDGVRMRCGGPGMCKECAKDLANLQSAPAAAVTTRDLRNLLKHAFMSGRLSGEHPITDLTVAWAGYDPTESATYKRILSALSPHPPLSPQEGSGDE